MKKFFGSLILALMLWTAPAQAISIGPNPTFQCGGTLFTDLTNLKILSAHVVTSGRRTGFRSVASGTTAGYQVATAFVVWCVCAVNPVPGGNTDYSLLYGDNDVGLDSSSDLTTPKYSGNDPAFYSIKTAWGASGAATSNAYGYTACTNPMFAVPINKYIAVKASVGPASFIIYGYDR